MVDAVEAGTPVRDVYNFVFQPCQYELGRLWQMNEISIAEEHYCTAVTQLGMSLLYPRIPAAERAGHRLLATCAGGNLHEIGARFVADFFEMEGWDTIYLGATLPAEHIVRAVVENDVDVVAVSATLVSHLRAAREIVAAVRHHPACRDVAVVLGGHPFRVARDLWLRLGADGSANDARGAVELAKGLVAARA
ncbi:MAG: cobalamin-dependent protein [Minicystis sp.]